MTTDRVGDPYLPVSPDDPVIRLLATIADKVLADRGAEALREHLRVHGARLEADENGFHVHVDGQYVVSVRDDVVRLGLESPGHPSGRGQLMLADLHPIAVESEAGIRTERRMRSRSRARPEWQELRPP